MDRATGAVIWRVDLPEAELTAVVEQLLARGVLGGLALGPHYAGMENALLVCATEQRTADDIETYARALAECLS